MILEKYIKNVLALSITKRLRKTLNQFKFQRAVHPKALRVSATDRILIISPHPDDESIGCGGLLLRYGSQCDVLCLTQGGAGIRDVDIESASEIRCAELQAAIAMTSAKVKILNAEDGALIESRSLLMHLDFSKYDIIALPNPLDTHSDHGAVLELLRVAHEDKKIHESTDMIIYEIWSTLTSPNRYIDISNVILEKRKLINCYESQVAHINYAERISSLNYFRGLSAQCEYAEAYYLTDIDGLLELYC